MAFVKNERYWNHKLENIRNVIRDAVHQLTSLEMQCKTFRNYIESREQDLLRETARYEAWKESQGG